jgi:hypothetical protein
MGRFLLIILTAFLPLSAYSQPLDQDLQEVQFFFGEMTDLNCCLLVSQGVKSPYKGFLLTPYQLVSLKDTIDSWDEELQLQLANVNMLCDSKLSLCQSTRTQLVEDFQIELDTFIKVSKNLELLNTELAADKNFFKLLLYLTVPLAIISGIYIGHTF